MATTNDPPAPEAPPVLMYEVCDFCDNMVPEEDLPEHQCPEAIEALQQVARELLEHEAGERDSDGESVDSEAENTPSVQVPLGVEGQAGAENR